MFPRVDDERIVAKSGTTTIGLATNSGVVFATDTRVTAGLYIAHRKGKKLFALVDHMAVTIAGRVADAQSMIDLLRANINYYQLSNNAIMNVGAASRLAANVFFANRPHPLVAQVIIGGVDPSGPHLFNIDYTGTLTEEKIVSTGSGSPVAYGTIESEYREDLEMTEAISLAAKGVATAIKRNAGTGDNIDIAVIDRSMKYRELTLEEKKKHLQNFFAPLM
ncbi:MAG: proteasome subunit beta [Aigarchaeota archaeon]|nr:proteasome subunit beta [Aigarchaeota archaeon]